MTELLTETEAAERLRIPRRTLRQYRAEGRIAFVQFSSKNIRYRDTDCEAFITDCMEQAPSRADTLAKGRKRSVSKTAGRSGKIVPFSQRSKT